MRQQTPIKNSLKFTVMVVVCFGLFMGMVYKSIAQEKKDRWEVQPPRTLSLSGKIESPANGSKVRRQFSVSGSLTGQPRHLWLVERIGELHWPKEPELKPISGQWHGKVFEGGYPPEGKFELLLVDISEETSNAFRQYLTDGQKTGNYPGLTVNELGSVIILDKKKYQLLTK